MNFYTDINCAVAGATAYRNGKQVARDVEFNLPEVTNQTVEVKAQGNIEVPITGWIDPMELTITKIGVDMGLIDLIKSETESIELRWAMDVKDTSGAMTTVGYKAFLRGTPKKIPSIEVKPGEQIETEIPFSVDRYRLVANNQEVINIDQIAGIYKIGGTDYAKKVTSLL